MRQKSLQKGQVKLVTNKISYDIRNSREAIAIMANVVKISPDGKTILNLRGNTIEVWRSQ